MAYDPQLAARVREMLADDAIVSVDTGTVTTWAGLSGSRSIFWREKRDTDNTD